MNQNSFDRLLRIILGGALVIISSYYPFPPLVFWIFTVVGIILILTGLTGYCPIYHLFKFSTKK